MQTLTAKDAKNGFGRLIDLARAAPVDRDGDRGIREIEIVGT